MIRTGLAVAMLIFGGVSTREVRGDSITPVSATATGVFTGNASVFLDGIIPPRGTLALASIDFGNVQTVANRTITVHNNDDSLIQSSTGGKIFKNLCTFLGSDGPVSPGQGDWTS